MELELQGRRIALGGQELVVGGQPPAGLVLDGLLTRHAAIKPLGPRMATIRRLEEGATILVNGVSVAREETPLLHGDVITIGSHEIRVLNPAHPAGTAATPPVGARERLHDTLFGVRRDQIAAMTSGAQPPVEPPAAEPAPPARSMRSGQIGIIIVGVVSVGLLLYLLFG